MRWIAHTHARTDNVAFVGLGEGVEGIQHVVYTEEDAALWALLQCALQEANDALDGGDLRGVELRSMVLLVHCDVGHRHVGEADIRLVRFLVPGHVCAVCKPPERGWHVVGVQRAGRHLRAREVVEDTREALERRSIMTAVEPVRKLVHERAALRQHMHCVLTPLRRQVVDE